VGTVDLCRTRRQTDSAIKPFIYAQAFQEFGYTGGTMVMDEPVSFDLGNGSLYEPKNFDSQFHGSVTLAQALGNSFNIPAIKLTHQLGVVKVINNINQLRHDYGQNLT
jgi:membrane carboxypeptidase/penicillin-binding protein PbpC